MANGRPVPAWHGSRSVRQFPSAAMRVPPPDVAGPGVRNSSTGGGTLARQNALERCTGGLAHEVMGVRPQYEQRVPHSDRVTIEGHEQQSIMDVMYFDPSCGREVIDVCFVSAKVGSRTVVSRRTRQDAGAAEAAAQRKK